jgi:penicillin V acylase-like amidase (Ntn superfamily)
MTPAYAVVSGLTYGTADVRLEESSLATHYILSDARGLKIVFKVKDGRAVVLDEQASRP